MDEHGLRDLFSFILKHNGSKDITGILLSSDNLFLQVLEGNGEVLGALFDSIKRDTRHKDILTLLDRTIDKRIFEGYSAGFSILKEKKEVENLNNYLSLYDAQEKYPKNIQKLLEPFLI